MIPFWFSLAQEAYAGGPNLLRPTSPDPASWAGDWRYMLGDALLVAPIIGDEGQRDVPLPQGARWYDWWTPEAEALEGGQTLPDVALPLDRVPLYVKEGAILPLEVKDDTTGLGDPSSADKLTVLVWPGPSTSSFTLHEEDEQTTSIAAQVEGMDSSVFLSRVAQPTRLRVRVGPAALTPASLAVTLDNTPLDRLDAPPSEGSGWWIDPSSRAVWVQLPPRDGNAVVQVSIQP
jgi:alpha-D-xyloside xylohydrolase